MRKTPPQWKDDHQTIIFRTQHVPKAALVNRLNCKNSDCLFPVNDPIIYSYIYGDIVWEWKSPDLWNNLKIKADPSKMLDEDEEYDYDTKTVKEASEYTSSQTLIYSCFNGIPLDDFVSNINRSTASTEEDEFVFNNSDELMDAINAIGLVINDSLMFDEDDIINIEDKRETVKVTERGLISILNVANAGIEEMKKTKTDGFHDLPTTAKVEWFFPYFDQFDGKKDTNLFVKTQVPGKSDEWEYRLNEIWYKRYFKCQHRDYRKDKRVTLLYRRYNPNREIVINKNHLDYDIFLSSWKKNLNDTYTTGLNNIDKGRIYYKLLRDIGYGFTDTDVVPSIVDPNQPLVIDAGRILGPGGVVLAGIQNTATRGTRLISRKMNSKIGKMLIELLEEYNNFLTEKNPNNIDLNRHDSLFSSMFIYKKKEEQLEKYTEDIYNARRRIFGTMRKTAKRKKDGWIFLNFNGVTNQ
jgi:hypothetical protein